MTPEEKEEYDNIINNEPNIVNENHDRLCELTDAPEITHQKQDLSNQPA